MPRPRGFCGVSIKSTLRCEPLRTAHDKHAHLTTCQISRVSVHKLTTYYKLLTCYFKGTEHALLAFSGFPSLVKEGMRDVPKDWRGRRQSLAMLCFFTRAYNYPDDVFTSLGQLVDFKVLHKRFYRVFQESFCKNETKVRTHTCKPERINQS